jgi:TPR repeat protein
VGFRLPAHHPSQDKYGNDDFGRIWAPLRPELMPPPPREETGLLGLGLVAGLFGAVGAAAAIALVVTNVVRLPVRFPTLNAAISSEDVARKSQSVSSIVLADLSQIQGAQANVQPAEPPPAPTRPMITTAHANAFPVDTPSAAAPSTPLQVAPSQPAAQAPPPSVSAPPTTTAVPESRATVTLAPDEIASMLKRGRELISAGDIPSGRLLLTHVAEAGNAEAAFLLAGTYDAALLAKLRVVGVQPDPAKAEAWYAKAAEEGSIEAKQHLRQSARR